MLHDGTATTAWDHRRMRDLPSGTVTFLFTDVEGSTRLLQERAADYGPIMATHRDRIRTAVAAQAGVPVDSAGDGMFFVFGSASAAVTAAALAQRSLSETTWPDGVTVRVRMGLHTGEGRVGIEGYVGLDVHRAARICAAAHGGQVIFSQATLELVDRNLPDGTSAGDLGRHWLKDLDQPEHLWQLLIAGLPADFAAPRGRAGPARLPVRLTSFVGRGNELDQLRQELDRNRLLTLTGPGGTGKTRLALALAASEEARYEDGAVFVDLAPLVDAELVASVTASRLEVPIVAGRSVTETLARHLSEREMLLVLDNFEQVLPGATMVAELLAASPRLRIVVTSRAPLHVMGEQEWPVPALGLPEHERSFTANEVAGYEAIQLFIQRARSVQPSFAMTDSNAQSVVEICRRLDGIPLAIELAAARIRLMPPQILAERLAGMLDLGGSARDAPERQRTLRSTIAWSVDLLGESDRRLFARLATFVGGWTLDAAERIVGEGDDRGAVDDGLGRLLEQSLITSDPADRTRGIMLETIREYALELLKQSDEHGRFARRHAGYFLDLAEVAAPHLQGPDRDRWLARLVPENDNFRAAIRTMTESGDRTTVLRIATALMWFWHLRNQLAEGRAVFAPLLDTDLAELDPPVVAAALSAAGELAVYQMDFEASGAYVGRSLEMYRHIGDRPSIAHQLNTLAWGSAMRDADAAFEMFRDALRVADGTGADAIVGNALVGAATMDFRLGRMNDARSRAQAAIRAFESAGERHLHVFALVNLGLVAAVKDDPRSAFGYYSHALQMASESGSADVIGSSLDAMALLLLDLGSLDVAVRLGAASERIRNEVGGTGSVDMAGLELPLDRAVRIMDAAAFERARREGAELTTADAVREGLALARRGQSERSPAAPDG